MILLTKLLVLTTKLLVLMTKAGAPNFSCKREATGMGVFRKREATGMGETTPPDGRDELGTGLIEDPEEVLAHEPGVDEQPVGQDPDMAGAMNFLQMNADEPLYMVGDLVNNAAEPPHVIGDDRGPHGRASGHYSANFGHHGGRITIGSLYDSGRER
jgi:hypothetical protein